MKRERIQRGIARVLELGGAGLVVFLVGFVLGGLLVFGLHRKHWLGGAETRHVEAFSDVEEPRAGELAARFRPVLEFDSTERWRPLNVAALLDEGRHRFCTRRKGHDDCPPIVHASDFDVLTRRAAGLGPATYLDLAGGRVPDYHGPERCPRRQLDCGAGAASAIYYHVTQSNDRFYVDYWWFLRFNHFSDSIPVATCRSRALHAAGVCDEHEGDWEGVTVVTPPDRDDAVDYVVYAAHKGTFRYTASGLRLRGGTRPYVFVAQGSHASYATSCKRRLPCAQPKALAVDGLLDLPEERSDGGAPWARNDESCAPNAPGSCLLSLGEQAWTTWPGQWGSGCGEACGGAPDKTSPRSPGLQARYQTPWCSTQGGVFTCDSRALRCSDWLGPLVVAVACDPGLVSEAQRATEEIEPGALALVVRGRERSQATTAGVVQALGDPLRPGERIAVVAGGSATQILVRAQDGNVVVEDRFASLGAKAGQRIAVTVTEGPTVSAEGHEPVEHRVVRQAA